MTTEDSKQSKKVNLRRDKFVRLAEKRVNKAVNEIKLIGNLSNRSSYDYGDKDVKQIFMALSKAMSEAKSQYSPRSGGKTKSGFQLK
jgi:hypothetical protein